MRTLAAFALGLSGLVGVALVDAATPASDDDNACGKIENACKAAGFAKGEHSQGKGLGQDCMKPIISGQTVSGVTVDAAIVQDCRAERAEAKNKPSK